ncbi:MAG: carbonic anhydrase [Actinomycetes bacterium]
MKFFGDLISANHEFANRFTSESLSGDAKQGLAIVTCMDSRIDPLKIVGMQAGDAKILRNAGARVTEDVLRTLILATHLLGVKRILVMPHTDCRMAAGEESEIHALIKEKSGIDTRSIEIRTVKDQVSALKMDVIRIETYPLLAPDIEVMGAIYSVQTGLLEPVD